MSKTIAQEIKKDEKRERELIEALAASVAKLEHLDVEKDLAQAERDRLKTRKARGKVYDQALLKKYNDEVRDINAQIASIRKRRNRRRSWLKKIRLKLRKKRIRARNAMRPKIINLKLDFKPMTPQTTVDKVIGHYTAGPTDESTQDAIRLCRQYHAAHLAQGWSGEAYMICFTRDGDILLLRPAKWQGAHTLGENDGSYGIMVHGTTGDTATKAQKRAMRWWAKNGHKKVMGPAKTQKQPKQYPWFGHRDFTPTACPGSFESTYRSKGK